MYFSFETWLIVKEYVYHVYSVSLKIQLNLHKQLEYQ